MRSKDYFYYKLQTKFSKKKLLSSELQYFGNYKPASEQIRITSTLRCSVVLSNLSLNFTLLSTRCVAGWYLFTDLIYGVILRYVSILS